MSISRNVTGAFAICVFCTNLWAMEDVKALGGMRNVAPSTSVNSGRPSLSRDELATLFVQGGNLLREKRFREAAGAFTQVISAAPNFDSAWAFRGFALGAMGSDNYERAQEDFCKAIELNPRNQHAYYGRALINRVRNQDYSSDLNMAAQLGHKEAQQMLQNASAGSNMPQANNGRGTMPEARPITRVEPREITRVEAREITRVEAREITRVEKARPISRVEIDADSKRRGKTIDPHGQGLNQAQIDAMEAQRRAMWNATGGGMGYR